MAFDSVATNCRLVIHTVDLPATLIWVPNKGTWSASRPVSFFKVQRETKRIATKNGSQLAPLIRSGSPLVLDNGTISTLYHYQPGTCTLVRFPYRTCFSRFHLVLPILRTAANQWPKAALATDWPTIRSTTLLTANLIAKVSLVGRALAWVLFTTPPGRRGRVCTSQRRFCTT